MKHTDETKQRLSEMRQGEKNPFYGHKHTEETREKLAGVLRTQRTNRQYDISPVTIRIPKEPQIAYLAGIVDGEGSIGFRRTRPFLAVYNTSTALMDWLCENVGGTYGGHDKRGRELAYSWSVQSARNVYVLCRALLPYLIMKADRAREVMAYLEEKYGKEHLNRMDGY